MISSLLRVGILLIFLVLFPALAFSQQKSKKKMIRSLQADIGYLASDALGGRRTGSADETTAANYLIARYEKLHIPAFEGSYRQPFTFVRGREIGSTTVRLGGRKMAANEHVFPFAFSANAAVSGDVLIDVQEQGAVWLMPIYTSEQDAQDPHFDVEKEAWDKARDAAKKGAAGIAFYDNYGSPYAPEFNPASEYETVDIPVIFIGHEQWQKVTAEDASAIAIDMNIALIKPERKAVNVAAFIDNHKPLTVVMGAHYDHLGHGEDGGSLYTGKAPMIHNGADDNASGTAALIQLAIWVKKARLNRYNYLFVHFSGEELGLLGSKAFTKRADIDSSHIAYMINMDMVGRLVDSTKALTVGGVGTSAAWGKVIEILRKDGFNTKIDSSGIGPSDHTSFYEKGIPVLFFFTGIHSDYHKPSDDADKINYAGEVMVIDGMEDVIKTLDDMPRPAFRKTKNTSIGRVRFKVTLGIMPDYSWNGEGLRADGIIDGKPADKAGLHAGDIIIGLGNDVVKGMQSYMEALSHQQEGAKSAVTIMRDGKMMTLPIQFQ